MNDKTQLNRPLKGLGKVTVGNDPNGNGVLTESVIQLPRDMYLHTPVKGLFTPDGCPTEWWWHTGTLKADDGRLFGFEINAAAFYPDGFTEVMLTDVSNQKHYQQTNPTIVLGDYWAESDPTKDWQVNLQDVHMSAPQADPTKNMVVKAKLVDGLSTINFDLKLSQKGLPLIVWGTGVTPTPTPPTTGTNNYYFSLTRLEATGTIEFTYGDSDAIETINVTGVTWMDHEWGLFSNKGKAVTWILQDMQLNNGVCISNYSLVSPVLNKATDGMATVLLETGESIYVKTTMTPTKSWSDALGKEFFTEITVEIPDFEANFVVNTLMNDQLFTAGAVYEGAGTVSGTMVTPGDATISTVEGTAWIEQTI